METLPLDLLLDVAVYLDTQDLLNASLVSKAWRASITATPHLWQHPRFRIAVQKGQKRLSYKPSPSVACRYLGNLPIRSLHLSGAHGHPITSSVLSGVTKQEAERELEKLLEVLPAFNDHRALHVVLDDMNAKDMTKLSTAVRNQLPVLDRLSHGTRPTFSDLVVLLHHEEKRWHHRKILGSCEIYPTSFDTIGFNTFPAPSVSEVATYDPDDRNNAPNRSALFASPDFDPDNMPPWPDLDEADGHVRCLSLLVPKELHGTWREWDIRPIHFRSYQELAISGGSWLLGNPHNNSITGATSGTLESLKLINVWKLVCTNHARRFDKLVSIQLSFHPDNKTKWGAIENFLSSIIGPQIENIHVEFPQQPEDAVRHDHIDAIWKKKISQCYQLKQVTLVNYIPSTLKAMFADKAPARGLEKLLLANDILPRNFITDFVPENLPRLNRMDISGARLFRRKKPQDMDAWVVHWRNARVDLLLPSLERSGARDSKL